MADVLVIACPECGKEFQVPTSAAGKKVRCKTCGEVIPVGGGLGPGKSLASPKAKAAPARPAKSVSRHDSGVLDDDGKPYGLTEEKLGARCPECANEMGENDVICLKCGYNVKVRQRITFKKLKHHTGFDIFLYLLPGILCALLDIFLLVANILYLFKFEDWFPKEHILHIMNYGFFKVWIVVISLFILYITGKFAIKRLIFHPQPPEVELK